MELITLKFKPRDMIFNNGIVNLYRFLEERNFHIKKIELQDYLFVLKIEKEKNNDIFFDILKAFFKVYKIVHQTDNDRWYFDEKKKDFILDKKFDTVGGQKNDLRNGVYLYKNISEFKLSREEVERRYLSFCEKNGLTPEMENGKLKVPNKNNEVIVAITLDEAIERFIHYFVNGDVLNIDSKIHTFEDGQGSFHHMLVQPKDYKLDKWEALVYWFGGRVQRLYNYEYYIYPNSSNLYYLKIFKEFLNINDTNVQMRNKKHKIKSINTNIDFYTKLSRDGIDNSNFYISKSQEEFEVKFFMYLYSIINHIEEQYEKAKKRRKVTREEIYTALQFLTFVVYTDDGTFKTSLYEYTKAYRLIRFLEVLGKADLFAYLGDLLITLSLSQKSKEVNLNLQRWCQNLLNFASLRNEYYLASFHILKNDSKLFGKLLFEFEQLYLKNILGEKHMNIHKLSKKLGDEIGYFCAQLGDKDLLFKLRSIKNHKQMIAYFKDLKFSILKNEDKAKFSKEFNDSLNEILEDIEQNWEIVRDYIAIYAIDKYRAVTYAKSNQGDK
jgi:hypothetical protein